MLKSIFSIISKRGGGGGVIPTPPANVFPIAEAGSSQVVSLPTTTATLTGSGIDSDGTIASYAWSKLSGPSGGIITSPSTPSTGITGLGAGVYVFQLAVTDNQGATATDTVTITVMAEATPPSGTTYVLHPDSSGYLTIDNSGHTYVAGDWIQIANDRVIKAMNVENFAITGEKIIISPVPGQNLTFGNPLWNGESYAEAIVFRRCSGLIVGGLLSDRSDWVISHSTQSLRVASQNFKFELYCHDMIIRNFTSLNGGNTLFFKSEVTGNPESWFTGSNYQDNIEIYNFTINGSYNEGMYIGHTATYWNIDANSPFYPSSPSDTTATDNPGVYKRPIKLRNITIHTGDIINAGADGLQTAACDNLEVYGITVNNYGTRSSPIDCAGMINGGRNTNTNFHHNKVHDGFGDGYQLFAEGGGHQFKNNLGYNAGQEGLQIKSVAGTVPGYYDIDHNTIASPSSHTVRVNYFGGVPGTNTTIKRTILAAPGEQYIYYENGASSSNVIEGTSTERNSKFATLAAADLDSNYLPNNPGELAGYRP